MAINCQWNILFLFLLFICSCSGQKEQKINSIDKSKGSDFQFFQAKIDTNDIDPYFTENNYLITDHGPTSITRNIIQDKMGKFWFATWNGIISYDGKQFTNHTNQSGLRRHRIFCILESDDAIWFGTIGAGAYKYDGSTFQNITSKDGFGSDEVECMLQDRKGNIWFGTGDGVTVYDGQRYINYTLEDGLLDTDVHGISEDNDGNIWVGSGTGICIFNPDEQGKGSKSFVEFKNAEGRSFNNVRTIMRDSKGAMWFCGNDGLIHYDGRRFTKLTEDFVGYMYEDSKGDVWFNKPGQRDEAEMGLFLHKKGESPSTVSRDNITMVFKEKEMVFGIMEDREGNIWYGRISGISRYDGKSLENF